MRGVVAHELGHIVFGDSGPSRRKTEFRADRFSHFLTGNCSGMAGYLKDVHASQAQELQILRDAGRMGKIAAFLRDLNGRRTYGTPEARMANLEKPLAESEVREFGTALQSYKAKFVHHDVECSVLKATHETDEEHAPQKKFRNDEIARREQRARHSERG